jgi:hypothetical protein
MTLEHLFNLQFWILSMAIIGFFVVFSIFVDGLWKRVDGRGSL